MGSEATLLCKYVYGRHKVSVIPGKFRNVVLEKDGDDQLDRSCEK